jgi:hypothetical protein
MARAAFLPRARASSRAVYLENPKPGVYGLFVLCSLRLPHLQSIPSSLKITSSKFLHYHMVPITMPLQPSTVAPSDLVSFRQSDPRPWESPKHPPHISPLYTVVLIRARMENELNSTSNSTSNLPFPSILNCT